MNVTDIYRRAIKRLFANLMANPRLVGEAPWNHGGPR